MLLLIGLLMFGGDGPFVRPHPAFWRVVLACEAGYLLLLVFVLFQVPPAICFGRQLIMDM